MMGTLTSFVLQQVPRSKDIESEMTSTPVAVERHRHRTEAGHGRDGICITEKRFEYQKTF